MHWTAGLCPVFSASSKGPRTPIVSCVAYYAFPHDNRRYCQPRAGHPAVPPTGLLGSSGDIAGADGRQLPLMTIAGRTNFGRAAAEGEEILPNVECRDLTPIYQFTISVT